MRSAARMLYILSSLTLGFSFGFSFVDSIVFHEPLRAGELGLWITFIFSNLAMICDHKSQG